MADVDLPVAESAYATHCQQLAKVATDLESRGLLKEMAAEWLKLAEKPAD